MGKTLFWDEDKQKLWSEDLCMTHEGANCICSAMGMVPNQKDDKVDEKQITQPNKMDYGSACAKWWTTDELPWCYVGFDSTCADRTRSGIFWPNTFGDPSLGEI